MLITENDTSTFKQLPLICFNYIIFGTSIYYLKCITYLLKLCWFRLILILILSHQDSKKRFLTMFVIVFIMTMLCIGVANNSMLDFLKFSFSFSLSQEFPSHDVLLIVKCFSYKNKLKKKQLLEGECSIVLPQIRLLHQV